MLHVSYTHGHIHTHTHLAPRHPLQPRVSCGTAPKTALLLGHSLDSMYISSPPQLEVSEGMCCISNRPIALPISCGLLRQCGYAGHQQQSRPPIAAQSKQRSSCTAGLQWQYRPGDVHKALALMQAACRKTSCQAPWEPNSHGHHQPAGCSVGDSACSHDPLWGSGGSGDESKPSQQPAVDDAATWHSPTCV